MSGAAASPGSGHIYLARGGVMAPIGQSKGQLSKQAAMASFSAYEAASPQTLQVVSLITSEERQVPYDYPVFVISPKIVKKISAVCIGGR
jgi:hypothetical protein